MPWSKRVDLYKCFFYPVIFCWILALCPYSTFAQQASVLSTGSWYKIGITQSGIYKIDASFLKTIGVDVSRVSPGGIRLYGNGGAMLPQPIKTPRNKDLVENAVMVVGEEDGRFDAGDAIYFYGESPHTVSYDSLKAVFTHQVNYYSDTTYYFLTFGDTKGLRISNQATLAAESNVVTQFDDYWYHEQESVNLLRSGREWWGEYIGNSSAFTIQADLPEIVPSSNLIMSVSAIAAAQVPTRLTWQLNGATVGEAAVGVVGAGTYDIKGIKSESRFVLQAPATSVLTAGVSFNKNGQTSAQAYLNYVALQSRRNLKAFDHQQIYRFAPMGNADVTYQIGQVPAGWLWWNVGNPALVKSATLTDKGNSTYNFSTNQGNVLNTYVGFTLAQAFSPVSWSKVANQNLSAYTSPDLLIVTGPSWLAEARRLADFRSEHDGLDVAVVTTDQVFNEFSGGKPDVSAIRDFLTVLHRQEPDKLKYLLLFGDATYDYKNILGNQSQLLKNNWVPVYESRESLNPIYTYSSDDYFGFLEEEEGDWLESTAGDYSLEIGIGRLPVKSLDEATIIVDKLIHYASSPVSQGSWQNTIHFVADDGDATIHQQHADALATLVGNDFLSSRIFLDAYPQTTTSAGQKVPAVNDAIKKSINDGTLILNYTGHGGTSGWAEEQVLTFAEMQTVRGYNNLPLLVTATCDFGRYDDPALVSGAELMVLSPRGAAIGAVSTTRPVYSSTNFTINQAFYEAILQLGPEGRMGDIFRDTKNNSLAGSLNRNFTLLGDPSMQLKRPEKKVLRDIQPDTLRALEKVTLHGKITNAASIDENFQGTARVAVYDKKVTFRTLGNEGDVKSYEEFSNKLFDGNVRVENGAFLCTFVMPKDIDYRTGIGRVSIYALSTDSLSDASGQLDVWIGGSATLGEDDTPPKISAYLNSPSFRNDDTVEGTSVLYVNMSDENGINVSKAGIGHNITLTLNDTLVILLNDYYTAAIDNFKQGVVTYPFDNLPAGKYVARIKVWDTYTNSSELTFGFQVGLPKGIKLNSVIVYPNPFEQDLSFEINHSRVDEDVEIVFDILLNSGQKLGSFQWQSYNSESVIKKTIPVSNLSGLTSGINSYVYVLKIRSLKDNSLDTRSSKLLRLRQ